MRSKDVVGSYVAEHRSPVPANLCRVNRAGDVIVTGSDVGHERPQRVERCFEALPQLFVHVFADALHRYVTGAFDHYLDVVLPRLLRQLAKRSQFCELCLVVGVVNRPGTKAISQTEGTRRKPS